MNNPDQVHYSRDYWVDSYNLIFRSHLKFLETIIAQARIFPQISPKFNTRKRPRIYIVERPS